MRHFFDKEQVKAKKQHRCEWCRNAIKKGSKYFKQTSVEKGDGYYTYKTHRLCYYIAIKANEGSEEYFDLYDSSLNDEDIKDIIRDLKKNKFK